MPSSLPEDNPFRASVLPETQVLLAGQDLLTGLSSRAGLEAHFRLAVARARRSGARFGVGLVVVGVDPTQPPDEVFGHDLTVVDVAKRLRATLRETDLIGRLGETRFAFLAEEVSAEGADALVGRVVRALATPAPGLGPSAPPKVGVAVWESDEQGLALLLRQAEQALTGGEILGTAKPAAANAESFGLDDGDAPSVPSSTGQRLARRAIGWLSLATLLVLALSATPAGWRERWLPFEPFVTLGGLQQQAKLPSGSPSARRGL